MATATTNPPRVRGATATLRRDRPSRYWIFERNEAIRNFPKDAPGAQQWLDQLHSVTSLPERGTKKVNVLSGLELHENVLSEDEEKALVIDNSNNNHLIIGRLNLYLF